jgi:hypothetical protein
MIEKAVTYKNADKDFISSLKKLGLSKDEINFILKKYKRKKFDDGGDSGGDSGGNSAGDSAGDSGPGGSDDGSGHGGPGGQGDSGPGGSDDGTGHGGPGLGGFGGGPGSFGDTFGSSTAQDQAANEAAAQAAQAETEVTEVDMTPPAPQTIQEEVMAYVQSQMTPSSLVGRAIGMSLAGPVGGFLGGLAGSNIGRGVTGPNDYSQATSSVQNGPAQTTTGDSGGITTIQSYAPLTNISSGDNTGDALVARLNAALKSQPVITGIPSISPYSNYTLLDLYNNKYI